MLKLWSLITKNYSTTLPFLIITATFLITFSLSASAKSITLAWEVNDDPEIESYEIHYGDSSGHYTHSIDAGSKTINIGKKIAYTIRGLEPGEYYFVVNSYDHSHLTYSKFSPEIKVTIPPNESTSSQTNSEAELPNEPSSYAKIFPDEISSQPQMPESDSQFHGAVTAQTPVIELGEAGINHNWTRITFNESFSDPIVIAKPLSYNDADPAVINIRNVDSSGFDIRIQEWDYLDGEHALERVGYLAMERGNYVLPDGTRLEADQQEAEIGSAFVEVPFLQEYQTRPIVIASINTNNSEVPLASRLQNIGTEGFQVLFQSEETYHLQELDSNETFSYIAWEPSSGITGNIAFEVNRTPDSVGHDPHLINYQQQPLESPIFLADIQTVNSEATANLRWQNKELLNVEVIIEKTLPQHNDEAEYAPESVGYALFGVASDD